MFWAIAESFEAVQTTEAQSLIARAYMKTKSACHDGWRRNWMRSDNIPLPDRLNFPVIRAKSWKDIAHACDLHCSDSDWEAMVQASPPHTPFVAKVKVPRKNVVEGTSGCFVVPEGGCFGQGTGCFGQGTP